MAGNNVYYAVIDFQADEIMLPSFPRHHHETIFLEILPQGYSKAAIMRDGCIVTSCTPIVQLFKFKHDDDTIRHVNVVIREEEPQHFVLREAGAGIPGPFLADDDDDDDDDGESMTLMDSDSGDPEYPYDIMDAPESEEDPSEEEGEEEEDDDDEENEDDEDDKDDEDTGG